MICPSSLQKYMWRSVIWKVVDPRGLKSLCLPADTKDEGLSCAKNQEGSEKRSTNGQGEGNGTHHSLDRYRRQRTPRGQRSRCQRGPWTVEGVFRCWCFQSRISTGTKEGRLGQAWLRCPPPILRHSNPLGVPCLLTSCYHVPNTPHRSLCSDWNLHFRSSPVSSLNPVWTPPSPGDPPRSPQTTHSNRRPCPINSMQVTLSFDVCLLFASLLRILEEEMIPLFQISNSNYSVRFLWHHMPWGLSNFLALSFLDPWRLNILCLGFHTWLIFWSAMIEPSSVTQWLTSFRKKNLLKLISLAQKWGFNGHLVIAGSSHHRPRVEDENAFSSVPSVFLPPVGAPTPISYLVPPDEPQC